MNESSEEPHKYHLPHFPINKGPRGGNELSLPQINNPRIIAALKRGEKLVKKLARNMRPTARPGREERFRIRITRALRSSDLINEIQRLDPLGVRVNVHESFGKPTLVSVDVVASRHQQQVIAKHLGITSDELPEHLAFLKDVLERVVEEVWDNPEIAPVAVRGRIVVMDKESGAKPKTSGHLRSSKRDAAQETVLLDMTSLGYEDEIARPADLYDRYNAPASDPAWRP